MKLREIERLRAVAVLMVMAANVAPIGALLPPVARSSSSGVDLFLVVSGYVVTLSLARSLPPLEGAASFVDALALGRAEAARFYARRLFRVAPPALAVLLAARLLVGIFPVQFGTVGSWNAQAVTLLGGVYNYAYAFHRQRYGLGFLWPLAVEEHFCLVLPLLFIAFRTTGLRLAACLGLALASVAARSLPVPDGADAAVYLTSSTHLRFDSLMAGVALALVSGGPARPALMPPQLMKGLVVPFALVVIACLPGAMPEPVAHREGFLALAVLSGLVVFSASLDRGYVLPVPGLTRALEYLGSRAYALYLTHMLVARLDEAERLCWPAYDRVAPRGVDTPWLAALVVFAGSLLAAEVLHRLVERPCVALGRRILDGGASPWTIPSRASTALAAAAVALGLFSARHALLLALGPPDLARGAPVGASSRADGRRPETLTNGVLEADGFRTDVQDGPWVTVDLGRVVDLGAIRVYNRDDGDQDRDLPLEVLISDDDARYTPIARREVVFTQQWPWRIRCHDLRARYLRLRVDGHAALGLTEIEVFADPAMAAIP